MKVFKVVHCPDFGKPIPHKRKPGQEAEQILFSIGEKLLNWNEAEEIFYAVQEMYDRMDVRQEVENRKVCGVMTNEEAAKVKAHVPEIAARYRAQLDEDVGEVWNNTLGYVLYKFLNEQKEA